MTAAHNSSLGGSMRLHVLVIFSTVLGGCASESLTGPPPSPAAESVATQASAGGHAQVILCRRGLMPTEPIYIVNGRIVSSGEALRIDKSLIDSVVVIKGAAVSSRYGSRASLGVVTIFARAEGSSRAR